MSKSKSVSRTLRSIVGTFVPSTAVEKLQQLAATIDPTAGLARKERTTLRVSSARVPDALIDQVASIAASSGGSVLGIAFDVEAARQTLAYASAARMAIAAARSFARLIEDDVLRRRSGVAERAFAIYGAMGRLVKTPEGKRLEPTYEQLQVVMRGHTRRHPKATTTSTTTPPTKAPVATA